jgi:hypothetical protein
MQLPSFEDQTHKKSEHTIVWGTTLERNRFLKLPKILAYLGRYDSRIGDKIQPRHILLIIALACRKFRDEPIRAYWQELASGLGVRADTVRKWAYELRDAGLLLITQNRGPTLGAGRLGVRNDRNSFDISPFVRLVADADARWKHERGIHEPSENLP